jgi:hypothetical protein
MSCFCFLVGTAGHEFLPGEHAIIKNLSVSAEIFFYEIELRYLLLVAKESDLSSN